MLFNFQSESNLFVKETKNKGYWIAGGHVDPGEDYETAAIREAKEEAGIDVKLEGIIRVEVSVRAKMMRSRIIFYATPINPDQPLKSVPDDESDAAYWMTVEEIKAMEDRDMLRGSEIYEFSRYVAEGGTIFPLRLLTNEGSPVVIL